MEAASSWRPLGRLLVDKGVISADELGEALAEQQHSGQLLGELLVALGWATRPAIVDALAEQAGVQIERERGFGTGLRGEIDRRHSELRERLERQEPAQEPAGPATELDVLLERLAAASVLVEQLRADVQELEARVRSAEPPVADAVVDDGGIESVLARAAQHVAERRARIGSRP